MNKTSINTTERPISQFRAALYDCDPAALRRQLHAVCRAGM